MRPGEPAGSSVHSAQAAYAASVAAGTASLLMTPSSSSQTSCAARSAATFTRPAACRKCNTLSQ